VNDYLYIHGGRDIKEGPMGNMWKLSISGVKSFIDDADAMNEHDFYGVSWEPVAMKGNNQPGNISHHKAAVFGSKVVIFGGIKEDQDTWLFDADKNQWSKVKQSGEVPKPRDDHSLTQLDEDSFMIFGGFVEGSRVNDVFIGKF